MVAERPDSSKNMAKVNVVTNNRDTVSALAI